MKAIDELIEKYWSELEDDVIVGNPLDMTNPTYRFHKDLETLKEQLKEQHKEDVVNAVFDIYKRLGWSDEIAKENAEQYYKETF